MNKKGNKKDTGVSLDRETVINQLESKYLNHGEKTLIQCLNLLEDELCNDVKNLMNEHDIFPSLTTDTIKEKILCVDVMLDQIWDGNLTSPKEIHKHFEGLDTWLSFLNNQTEPSNRKVVKSLGLLKSCLRVYDYLYNSSYRDLFDFSEEENDQQKDQKVQMKEVV